MEHYVLFYQEPVQNLLSAQQLELPDINVGKSLILRTYRVKHGAEDKYLYEDFMELRDKIIPLLTSDEKLKNFIKDDDLVSFMYA